MLSQMSLIAAIAAEIDRQMPGAVVNPQAMNAIIAAADAILDAQRGISVPMKGSFTPVANDDEGIAPMALDRIPGWEAA